MRVKGGTEQNGLETLTVLKAGGGDSPGSAWPSAGIPGPVYTPQTHHAPPPWSLSRGRSSYEETGV